MRKLLALLALVILTVACCAPRVIPPTVATPTAAPAPDQVHKTVTKRFYADSDFNAAGQAELLAAAEAWRRFTADRVHFEFEFSLSEETFDAHLAAKDPILIGVTSNARIVQQRDALSPQTKGRILAFTFDGVHSDGLVLVVLIMDRIDARDFRSTAIHELGHVLGMDHTAGMGDIMSAASFTGMAPAEFTENDRALCRRALLCD